MTTPGLSEDTPIYRFLSFFDVFNILKHKKLRITKMAAMDDLNEGLGLILYCQEDITLLGKYTTQDKIKAEHDLILENTYLSCWTKEPDLISMWTLYSKDTTGIRIKTTVGKLRSSVFSFHENHEMWTKSSKRETGDLLSREFPEICEVEYENFYILKEMIRERRKKYQDMVELKAFNNSDYLDSPHGFRKDWYDMMANRIIGERRWQLKDRAYVHENEIRAIVKCGIHNGCTPDNIQEAIKAKKFIEPISFATPGTLPNMLFVDVTEDFVEGLCFDPRCPQYQKDVYYEILQPFKVPLAESKAFGYAFDLENFLFDLDGNPLTT